MGVWKKCKALRIFGNRKFQIFLCIEGLLLAWGIAGLFGKDTVYEYDSQNMKVYFGSYDDEKGGCHVEDGTGLEGSLADFCDIALPKGVYSVELHYETDTYMNNICTVTDDTIGYRMLKTNGEHLYASLTHTDFLIWLLQDSEHLMVHAEYGGVGSLAVTGLTIRETNALSRIFLFWVILCSLFWNGIYIYIQYDKKYRISQEDKNVFFGLGLIIVFSSVPLMLNYMFGAGDLIFHLMRIEGIKDNLLAGQFPSRISPEWLQGYGYAAPVFYGETLLYIAAFFRLIGFTVTDSYRLFFLIINILTVFVSYHCFYRMFREKYIGLLCTALYSLSVYRYFKTFVCGSFGETFGILFLPLIAYGFYQVFAEDIHAPGYKRRWILLTIGFTGLIQSHFLTGEMAGGFTILLCLVFWKKTFRKETFLVLAKTVIYSVLLSFWFLVPFVDYMLTGDFVIQHVSSRTIQGRGLYLAHLLQAFPINGYNVYYADHGMVDSQPAALGAALIAAFLLWTGLWFFRKLAGLSEKEVKLGKIAWFFGLLSMLMSLSIFPWDRIQALGSMAATLVSSLQFPNRLLTISTVSLTVLAGVVAKWVFANRGGGALRMYCLGMTVLLTLSSGYLINDSLYKVTSMNLHNEEGMATGYIAGAEYLPYGTDAEQLLYRAPLALGEMEVKDCQRTAHTMDISCKNYGDTEAGLELPLLYYKGYQAYDLGTGKRLHVYPGTNFVVAVSVPAGYEGTVRTSFQSPWYWRMAEFLSLLTFIILCGSGYFLRRYGQKERREGAESYDQ